MKAPLGIAHTLAALAVAGCVATAADTAAAQDAIPAGNGEGFDLRIFRPAVDSKGQFTVNGTDILGAGDTSFGLLVDAGFNMLRIGRNDAPLVGSMISATLQFNVGIANLLVVGAQLPIHLVSGPGRESMELPTCMQAGCVPAAQYNPPRSGLNFQGLGDITAHVKLRWLRAEQYPVGLAIIVQGGYGIMGGPRAFAGEPNGFVWPMAAVEWRPARTVRVDLNLGARVPFALGSSTTIGRIGGPEATYGPSVTWGAGVSWRPAPVIDLVAETYGAAYLTGLGQIPASLPMEVIGGVKIFVQRNSYLMIGGGAGVTGFAAASPRFFVGIVFEPSIGDTDGDGYRDDVDQCVNDPEDFDGFQDEDGCSEPDNDRDGHLDAADQCPLVPEDRDNDHDEDGCPEGQEADRDGDGVLDTADQCADDPEDRDNFRDEDGCPEPDNDEDTIPDIIDNCMNDPEDRDEFQDDDGCPDPDNDQDTILDVNDQCPLQPETQNGFEDTDGCPDSGDLVIVGETITLARPILFATDSAEILPESLPIVDQMANLMTQNPWMVQVEVEGHTDVRANDQHNLQLSLDRANSVMRALVQRGIAPNRLVAAGYGEYCPRNPRNTPAAWEVNRRVQFLIARVLDENGNPVRTRGAAGCARAAQYIPAEIGPPGTAEARPVTRRRGGQAAGGAQPQQGGGGGQGNAPAAQPQQGQQPAQPSGGN